MKKIITLLFLLSFNLFQLNAQLSELKFSLNDFKSCWKIKDMVYEANGGTYSTDDAKKLTGEIICFNKDTVNILGDTMIHSKYTIKRESSEKFCVDNFEISEHLNKWFKITVDTLDVINLISGISVTTNPDAKIKQIIASPYEFAYDGKYLYLPDNGAMFRLQNVR